MLSIPEKKRINVIVMLNPNNESVGQTHSIDEVIHKDTR